MPPKNTIVRNGSDQTKSSMRPENTNFGWRTARSFDARYHQAKNKQPKIVGVTTNSITVTAFSRTALFPAAAGPAGVSTASLEQPESVNKTAPIRKPPVIRRGKTNGFGGRKPGSANRISSSFFNNVSPSASHGFHNRSDEDHPERDLKLHRILNSSCSGPRHLKPSGLAIVPQQA